MHPVECYLQAPVEVQAAAIADWADWTLRSVVKMLIASVIGVRNAGMVAGPLASLGTSSFEAKSVIADLE